MLFSLCCWGAAPETVPALEEKSSSTLPSPPPDPLSLLPNPFLIPTVIPSHPPSHTHPHLLNLPVNLFYSAEIVDKGGVRRGMGWFRTAKRTAAKALTYGRESLVVFWLRGLCWRASSWGIQRGLQLPALLLSSKDKSAERKTEAGVCRTLGLLTSLRAKCDIWLGPKWKYFCDHLSHTWHWYVCWQLFCATSLLTSPISGISKISQYLNPFNYFTFFHKKNPPKTEPRQNSIATNGTENV